MIRPLSIRGLAAALPLLEAQYREHRIELDPALLRAALRGLLRGRGRVLLATERGRAVGLAALSWTWTLERGGKVAWLDELYVVPRRRGRGLGKALLRRALREARAAGCAAVELEVVRGHGRAARLYLREGFAPLQRRRYSRPL